MAHSQITIEQIEQFLDLLATIGDGQLIRWDAGSGSFIPYSVPSFGDMVDASVGVSVEGNIPKYYNTGGKYLIDSGVPIAETKIIAYKTYSGGDVTTTSASQVDADATNLAVTFTAPVSGNVLVRLTAQTCPDTGANHQGAQHQWGLRESTTNLAGPHTVSRDLTGNGFAAFNQASKAFVITGLTPGSSHTYKWAHNVTASGTARIGASSGSGEAVMEIWALP